MPYTKCHTPYDIQYIYNLPFNGENNHKKSDREGGNERDRDRGGREETVASYQSVLSGQGADLSGGVNYSLLVYLLLLLFYFSFFLLLFFFFLCYAL